MEEFMPEGFLFRTPENAERMSSYEKLSECFKAGTVLEALCVMCTSAHELIVDLGCMRGTIPREEGALGIAEGTTRDIALISRVNKPVCFIITELERGADGTARAVLSRKKAQSVCMEKYISALLPGDIIPAAVTHFEPFGCFVDIGCGIPSLIPIDLISVSRISHPSDRFRIGQVIKAVVKSFEGGRVCLTHKELLGTWEENAAMFSQGETVTGIIRSIEEYGIFVELAPNLAGLAEPRGNACVDQLASVYIKAVIPDKMKIKLVIVNSFDNDRPLPPLKYFLNGSHIDRWVYSTDNCSKRIETCFS